MKKSTIITIIAIVAFLGGGFYLMSLGSPAQNDTLVGKPLPALSLRDKNGITYSNESLKGKNVVLFFNEGIMCYPACWNQMVALGTDPRFNTTDTVEFSVVVNQPSDWASAVSKMPELGKAAVLFDSDKSVSHSFGMLTVPSSMHLGSFPGHSFVLIDKQGIVRSVYDDPNMAIDNDRVFADMQKMN